MTEVFRRVPGTKIIIPSLFDTEIELQPGEYELSVTVTDGKHLGQTRIPLRVEPLDGNGIAVSDLALNSILRDASWIVRDATKVTPAPLIPMPLVSKNVQFLPAPNAKLWKNNPLSLYFEIYPRLEREAVRVSYRLRITDLKSGAIVMDTELISAADFVVPGNSVVRIGLTLDTSKLGPSLYRLEIQASDSAGRESGWRTANFNIQ